MTAKRKNQATTTPAQQAVRDRFRVAAKYATQLLQDAERKGHYARQAQERGLPNAYVAAVAEYLRTTSVMTITGSVRSALQLTRHRAPVVKVAEAKPVAQRMPSVRKPASVRKSVRRNAMAVCNIPGLSMAVACSGNVTAGKMQARKSRSGSITFTTTFYCD